MNEWRLRPVTNCLISVSFISQTKLACEVYVVDISWFELSRLFQGRMRQLIQWLNHHMYELLFTFSFIFIFTIFDDHNVGFTSSLLSVAWHWLEEESHARGVRIPGPSIN